MKDRSNGSACPSPGLDDAGRVSSHSDKPRFSAAARVPLLAKTRTTRGTRPNTPTRALAAAPLRPPTHLRDRRARRRRRTWIERVGHTPATTPMWTSRAAWLSSLSSWATEDVIRSVATRLGCSITAATMLRVATAMAEYADHATGRNVAVTRATLADGIGCSPRTITTAWKVLQETGWAIEASRGHGGPTTPTFGRRPSVWHLVPRRRAVEFCHLPPLSRESGLTPESSSSPSAHTCASARAQPKRRRNRRMAARPLAIQRLAGQLVALGIGLHRGHIGSVCDALMASGIDPGQWTAEDLQRGLDRDAQQSHWSWPDRIERPGAFLAGRLRRLVAAGATPSLPAASGTAPRRVEPPTSLPPAQKLTIAQAKSLLEVHLAELRARHTDDEARPGRRPQEMRGTAVEELGACAHCDAPDAPRRPHMPVRRAHICDACWSGG